MLGRRRAGFRSAGITLSGRKLRRWTVRGRGSRWWTSVLTGLATDFGPVLTAVLRNRDLDDEPLRVFARRLRPAAPARRAATDEALSPRELAVLGELCVGRANKEIGRQLDLAENTVKFHLKRIYEKLGAHTRSGAVTAAIQRGLIRID